MNAFDILGDPIRRRILEVLAGDRHTVGEIVALVEQEFDTPRSAISQHLKVLREGGFATVQVRGPRRTYAIDLTPMVEADLWMARFRRHWAPKQGGTAAIAESARSP